jgi:hypothetical protein
MKRIHAVLLANILLICNIFFISCSDDDVEQQPREETSYINENCILIQKRAYNSNEYTFLMQSTSEPDKYFLWCDGDISGNDITTKMFYSYESGDTLHWDFIKKKRFFKCKDIKLLKEYNGEIQQRRNH